MITNLLDVLDRLIDLATIREKRLKDAYANVFQPIFEDLESIHRNYLDVLTEAGNELDQWMTLDSSNAERYLQQARRNFENQRREFEPVRTKLRAFAAALDKVKLSHEVTTFVSAVVAYFPMGSLEEETDEDRVQPELRRASKSNLSPLGYWADRFAILAESFMTSKEKTRMHIRQTKHDVERTIRLHRHRWLAVTEAFAELRLTAELGHIAIKKREDHGKPTKGAFTKRFFRRLRRKNEVERVLDVLRSWCKRQK